MKGKTLRKQQKGVLGKLILSLVLLAAQVRLFDRYTLILLLPLSATASSSMSSCLSLVLDSPAESALQIPHLRIVFPRLYQSGFLHGKGMVLPGSCAGRMGIFSALVHPECDGVFQEQNMLSMHGYKNLDATGSCRASPKNFLSKELR